MFKKIISTSVLLAASLFSCVNAAQEPVYYITTEGQPIKLSYNFFKMGGGFVPAGKDGGFGTAIGVGRRFICNENAIEVSVNWVGTNRNWATSLPKVMYLHYINPLDSEGLYIGAGASYGDLVNHHRRFRGLQVEGAIGYEFQRFSRLSPFIELDVSQSAIPFSGRHHKSGPVITLAWGVGF